MWRTADAIHIDLRGLPPPEPVATVLQTIESGDVDTALVGHFDQEPILLYADLEERGWSHEVMEFALRRRLRGRLHAAHGALGLTSAAAGIVKYIAPRRRAALRR